MKKYFIVAAFIFMVGCVQPAIKQEKSNNAHVSVELLFENEGNKVYRFYDGGRYHYYVVPSGQTITTENCGKSCEQDVTIITVPKKNEKENSIR